MARAGQIVASSSYTSTSAIGSPTYDVFLNFRGEDARKGFTGHLYSALNRERMNVFMDNHELQEGVEIGPKLMEAIQGSKISIPIFSKGYADSKWCLMELEKILECHKSNGQIVLPIFLDVEPSDVRHQSGRRFQEAFLEHERDFHVKNSQPQRVKRWREALSEVGNMKGWVLKEIDNGDESTLIQRVVERILRETNNNYSRDVKNPIGLDSRVTDIQYLLSIGSKDVRLVGICGEGGIGKTTIAKALYNRFVEKFDQNCFLANIREEALRGPKGLVSLQKKLIYSISKRKVFDKILDVDHGKEEIRNRCQGVNVLLVLDDVDDRSQLDALAIDLKWLGHESRVIITTRDEHVLNVAKVDPSNIYRPKELDFDQSLRLFSLHAFGRDEPFEEYKDLSHAVARYSGGLPLTLEVLGSYLSDIRNKEEWENALQTLRASPRKEVYKKLKISYDNLEDGDQKAIFLDAACFFVGRQKEDVISIWEACGYRPKLAIKRLVQRSLLKFIAKEDSKEYLEMHDQIQDMGRHIVSEESCGMLGKCSRLWTRKEIVEVLEGHKGTENIKGILLPDLSENPEVPKVYLSIECLEKMSSLRFLDIPSALSEGDDFPRLPYGLRWFSWNGCPIKVLRGDFYHKSLVHLDLSRSKIQVAWNSKPQNEYKKFQNLKVLKLSWCISLCKCPEFSWFPILERLDLRGCHSLGDLDESIGQLRHLRSLDLCHCYKLSKLPLSIGQLSHLESLDLRSCLALNKLPQSIGDLKSLVNLQLESTGIDELPDGVGLLEKLEVLDIEGCKKLVKLPASMGRMRCLHSIDLNRSTSISELPNDFLMLSSLVELNMSSNICPLPICYSSFSQLQTLRLFGGCVSVESLPADLSDLKNLQELGLAGLEELRYLPELPSSLITLYCVDCFSLERLPDLSRLKILRTLYLRSCCKLKKIVGVEGMESLEQFWVDNCYKVTHTPWKQYFRVRPSTYEPKLMNPRWDEDEEEDEPLFLGPRYLGVLRRFTNSSEMPKAAGSDHLCLLESEGVKRDYSFSNANSNDGIRKRFYLIIVFAFKRGINKDDDGKVVQEGELVDIELEICTDVFGKDGKRTNCLHSILIENVEFTTHGDLIYVHDLEGFTWFGFPLEGKDALSELILQSRGPYELSEFGFCRPLKNCYGVELKFWSLEYVNEESGQASPNQMHWVDRIVKDLLNGPWPHLDVAAAAYRLFHSYTVRSQRIFRYHSARSPRLFRHGSDQGIGYYSRWFSNMDDNYVRTDCFGLEEPKGDGFVSHSVRGIRFSGFPPLRRLVLTDCTTLESLLAKLSNLWNLQELVFLELKELQYLPKLPSSLYSLECLACKSLERLPDLSRHRSLRILHLEACYKLEKIQELRRIKSLERFLVIGCYHKVLQGRPLSPCDLDDACYRVHYPHSSNPFNAGLKTGRKYSFLKANDGIHRQLFLIIAFAFDSFLKENLEEGELVDIELQVSTHIFGKDGGSTECCHTIFIENVEFTTKRDIIYIHNLQGFTWFGLPLGGKDVMSEISVTGPFLYKLSDSGVYHRIFGRKEGNDNCVELKSWSLEYVHEESGKALPNQELGDKKIIIDMLSGPWPHADADADAGAGSHRVFVSPSAFIEEGHFRSKYIVSNYGNVSPCLRDTKERTYFVLEGPHEEDNNTIEMDRLDSNYPVEEPEEDKRSIIEEIDSHPVLGEEKFSSACVDGGGSHSVPQEEEKSDKMIDPLSWELLLF